MHPAFDVVQSNPIIHVTIAQPAVCSAFSRNPIINFWFSRAGVRLTSKQQTQFQKGNERPPSVLVVG